MEEFKKEEFCRCKNCKNYRSLYYFDDDYWRLSGQAVCKIDYNIEEMDGMGCFKFSPKTEDYTFLENKQIKAMDIILMLKKELENVKVVIKEFEDAFYGNKN